MIDYDNHMHDDNDVRIMICTSYNIMRYTSHKKDYYLKLQPVTVQCSIAATH